MTDDNTPAEPVPYINPPPPKRYLDAWNAETRRILGLPAAPVLTDLPADVRGFVEGL